MAPVGQAGRQALQLPQWAVAAASAGSVEVQIDLAEEEIRAGVAVDQIGVLADPAQAGIARQRLFENRGAVGECAMAEGADGRGDPVAELLQARAQDLVVVAAERIAGNVAAGAAFASTSAGAAASAGQ